MKIAAVLSYDGNAFCGWQSQPKVPTVQDAVEEALSIIEKKKVQVRVAGRTDGGVHARGQVCSFDLSRNIELSRLKLALNANLSDRVRIMKLLKVEEDFDPRKDALWREYVYFVWNSYECYPHFSSYLWWNKFRWNDRKVKEACAYLEGEHDFASFCKASECPQNSVRKLYRVNFRRKGRLGILKVRGNAFLMNMVRTIVGSLDIIGRQKKEPEWIEDLFNLPRRIDAGPTAPASGLYLWRVCYRDFTS